MRAHLAIYMLAPTIDAGDFGTACRLVVECMATRKPGEIALSAVPLPREQMAIDLAEKAEEAGLLLRASVWRGQADGPDVDVWVALLPMIFEEAPPAMQGCRIARIFAVNREPPVDRGRHYAID